MNTYPKFATVTADQKSHYGIVTDTGFISLSNTFATQYPTLKDVIEAGKLAVLEEAAKDQSDDFKLGEFTYQIPINNAETQQPFPCLFLFRITINVVCQKCWSPKHVGFKRK